MRSRGVWRSLLKVRLVSFLSTIRFLESVSIGGCELDKAYAGPKLPVDGGKYSITLEFVREMMQWFKDGKALPKRYVWEIVLGAYSMFEKEPSMVDLTLDKGRSVDVIGDVHGWHVPKSIRLDTEEYAQVNTLTCSNCSL